MTIEIAVGMQWGDEGKGRVVDLLSAGADIVARYNGGDNAGHTVTVKERTFKLHLIPSGIVHPHTVCILGNGMVINPATLFEEIAVLSEAGIEVSPQRLLISHAAHLITPAHRLLDRAQDEARGGSRIGTTGRGIGPAYVDKAARRGLRAGDTRDEPGFRQKLYAHLEEASRQMQALYHQGEINIAGVADEYMHTALQLSRYVQDTGLFLRGQLPAGKKLLAEAAQGALLDIDHGTYPFVTSSTTTASGVFAGLGLGIQPVGRVIGIVKAFQTRVGSGNFSTEIFGEEAVRLRGTGKNPWDEFGTTTGRPRRVGWLDGALLKYAVGLNGVTELAVTKLDILSGFQTLKVCTAYDIDGREVQDLSGEHISGQFEPVYEELPGWQADLRGARQWRDLPEEARGYIEKIETICSAPVRLISVGPERDQVIKR